MNANATTPEQFLLERYDTAIRGALGNLSLSLEDRTMIVGMLMELKKVVEFHKQWPVLVESKPEFDYRGDPEYPTLQSVSVTQQMKWLTQQEYVKVFGTDPPTAPLIRELLKAWTSHEDFQQVWIL